MGNEYQGGDDRGQAGNNADRDANQQADRTNQFDQQRNAQAGQQSDANRDQGGNNAGRDPNQQADRTNQFDQQRNAQSGQQSADRQNDADRQNNAGGGADERRDTDR